MRLLLFTSLLVTSLWGAEPKPFLFVTLQYNGKEISLLSADTVMGTERTVRFERESPYRYTTTGSGGAAVESGAMPPPPPLHTSVAEPSGQLTSVPLQEVSWSFRIPLSEGVEQLKIFSTTPLESGATPPSTQSSLREIASFSLKKRGEAK